MSKLGQKYQKKGLILSIEEIDLYKFSYLHSIIDSVYTKTRKEGLHLYFATWSTWAHEEL